MTACTVQIIINMVKLEQEPDYCTCCFVIMSVVLLLNQPYVTLDVSFDHKRVSR